MYLQIAIPEGFAFFSPIIFPFSFSCLAFIIQITCLLRVVLTYYAFLAPVSFTESFHLYTDERIHLRVMTWNPKEVVSYL